MVNGRSEAEIARIVSFYDYLEVQPIGNNRFMIEKDDYYVKNEEDLDKIVNMVDSESNGLTICTGSLGSNLKNDIPHIIRKFGAKKRIAFMHVRNIQVHEPWVFNEVAHKSKHGSLDMFEIMKALYDVDFDGPIRPDHGRMIWNEEGRPGYGLYDRALGANYLCGLWDSINRIYGAK